MAGTTRGLGATTIDVVVEEEEAVDTTTATTEMAEDTVTREVVLSVSNYPMDG